MLILPDLHLGYQYVPKIATTSMFEWIYESAWLARKGKRPTRKFHRDHILSLQPIAEGEVPLASRVANTAADVEPYRDHYRFAITRDPVRRFISMYSNRVLFHYELSQKHLGKDVFAATGLVPDPEINVLVDRYEAYSKVQPSIHHHARPMIEFLGPDLGVFDRIYDISEIQACLAAIRAHLQARGQGALLEQLPPLGHSQTGGPKLGLEVLNPYSFEKLLEFYRPDYEQIPTVNLEKTKEDWRKAREQAFVSLAKAAAEVKAARESQKKLKSAAPRKAAAVEYLACPRALKVRVDMPGATPMFTGMVLLKDSVANGHRLQLVGPSATRDIEWGLPSGWLATKYPENPHARGARFRVDDQGPGRYEIRLLAPKGGESWPLARFERGQAGA